MLEDKVLTFNFDVPSEREKLCALGRAISIPDIAYLHSNPIIIEKQHKNG